MATLFNISRYFSVRLKPNIFNSKLLNDPFQKNVVTDTSRYFSYNIPIVVLPKPILTPVQIPFYQPKRKTSFLTTLSADQLWKGVISVSNAGKKRGRGKGTGKRVAKDLNRGQVLGTGKINMLWPGLNAPVLRGREMVQQQELPPDTERDANILKMRNSVRAFQTLKLNPLERGWSGSRMPGRATGPPDPIGEEKFESFDSTVLEMRMVCHMKGNLGRTRRMRVLTVVGNKNGLAGFALGKAPDGKSALRKSRNKAAQKLRYIERFDNHTVCHDFYCEYLKVKLMVQKKPKGFGLVCHRIIKSICEQIGITDIYAKCEKSTNPYFLTKAFFAGLQAQKTPQELSDALNLNMVEMRRERDNFPRLLAKPSDGKVRTRAEIPRNEITDYEELIAEGKVYMPPKKAVPFFQKLPGWQIHLKKTEQFRNFARVRTQLKAHYGERKEAGNNNNCQSFITIRERQRESDKIKAAVNNERDDN